MPDGRPPRSDDSDERDAREDDAGERNTDGRNADGRHVDEPDLGTLDYRIDTLDAVAGGVGPAVDLYASVWESEDPDAVAERFERHAAYPEYRSVAAETPDGRLLGFAYGYGSEPGQFYHDRLREALGADAAERWLTDCFEVVELAVAPDVQRRGVGGRLHDELLAGVDRRTAILTTGADNSAALALYRRRGWTVVERGFKPGPEANPLVVLGLDRGSLRE